MAWSGRTVRGAQLGEDGPVALAGLEAERRGGADDRDRASGPPARATKRLRMTRSRTLSSAPPMMMTVPSATGDGAPLRAMHRQRIADAAPQPVEPGRRAAPVRAGRPCENAPPWPTPSRPTCDPSAVRCAGAAGSSSTCPTWLIGGTRRRAGVFRRAIRREVSRLHDRRRILAIVLLSLTFALLLSGMIARGDAGGADARAYWAGVRIWLNGGDPYHPTGPFLPYVYAPWMLPMFTPWAALPWDVAWFAWRVGTILPLLWTIDWAYRRRPLTTALIVAALGFSFGANLDTGNINLQLTLMLWAAQFTGPDLGGLLWALATWMKWIPAVHWFVLRPRTRAWGLVWLGVSIALSVDHPAADDRPDADAVRLRGAPDPARLPRLPVGASSRGSTAARTRSAVLRPDTWRRALVGAAWLRSRSRRV